MDNALGSVNMTHTSTVPPMRPSTTLILGMVSAQYRERKKKRNVAPKWTREVSVAKGRLYFFAAIEKTSKRESLKGKMRNVRRWDDVSTCQQSGEQDMKKFLRT